MPRYTVEIGAVSLAAVGVATALSIAGYFALGGMPLGVAHIAVLTIVVAAITAPVFVAPLISKQRELERSLIKLDRYAFTDTLTGLPNRRSFFRDAHQVVRDANDKGLAVAGIIIDVDRFKRLNDSLGHEAGDRALKHVAGIIADTCSKWRAQDLALGRIGGEEFAIIVKSASSGEFARFAEEICIHVRKAPVELASASHQLTVSVGLAYSEGSATVDQLLAASDDMAYAAKADGRDRWKEQRLVDIHVQSDETASSAAA